MTKLRKSRTERFNGLLTASVMERRCNDQIAQKSHGTFQWPVNDLCNGKKTRKVLRALGIRFQWPVNGLCNGKAIQHHFRCLR